MLQRALIFLVATLLSLALHHPAFAHAGQIDGTDFITVSPAEEWRGKSDGSKNSCQGCTCCAQSCSNCALLGSSSDLAEHSLDLSVGVGSGVIGAGHVPGTPERPPKA